MILSFIGSVILIALGYILTKIYDKNKEISKPFAVVSLVLSILSTLATGFMVYKYFTINSIINSEKMFEAANDSITEAFKLMEEFALYKRWLVKGIIVTLITLVLFVGCMYMARMLRKRATEQDHQDSKDDTVAETKKAESSESDLHADSVPVDDSTSIADSTTTTDFSSVVDSTPIVDPADTLGKKTDLYKPEESSSKAIRCPRCGATYDKPVKLG
jgi:flagellar basal body-associated protein FliL